MFQSSDDFNLDEEFLKEAFDSTYEQSTDFSFEVNKQKTSTELIFQPSKKLCVQNDFPLAVTSSLKDNFFSTITKVGRISDKNVRLSNPIKRKVVQRKFPGPAGLLPERSININLNTLEDNDINTNKTVMPDEIICSQLSVDCFKEGLWEQMCRDYYVDKIKLVLPKKYSISWVKTKASSKQLICQKTPFLAAIIKSIDYTIKNPMIVLKDPTGEMPGTVHYEVMENYSEKLHIGAVIVLRQVGVLKTLKRNYLNITLNNLITIYSFKDHEAQKDVEITRIKKITSEEFLESIEKFKTNFEQRKVENDRNKPFFKQNLNISVDGLKSNNVNKENSNTFFKNKYNKKNSFYKESQCKIPNSHMLSKDFTTTDEKQKSINKNVIDCINFNRFNGCTNGQVNYNQPLNLKVNTKDFNPEDIQNGIYNKNFNTFNLPSSNIQLNNNDSFDFNIHSKGEILNTIFNKNLNKQNMDGQKFVFKNCCENGPNLDADITFDFEKDLVTSTQKNTDFLEGLEDSFMEDF